MIRGPLALTTEEAEAALAGLKVHHRITDPVGSKFSRLRRGDLVWISENFVRYVGRKFSGRADEEGIGYGPVYAHKKPENLAGRECKVSVREARDMRRYQSRLTLEILTARMDGAAMLITFKAHACNVDQLAEARA